MRSLGGGNKQINTTQGTCDDDNNDIDKREWYLSICVCVYMCEPVRIIRCRRRGAAVVRCVHTLRTSEATSASRSSRLEKTGSCPCHGGPV